MKILHVDCSVRNEASLSRALSASLVEQLVDKRPDDTSVIRLDLAKVSFFYLEVNCFVGS